MSFFWILNSHFIPYPSFFSSLSLLIEENCITLFAFFFFCDIDIFKLSLHLKFFSDHLKKKICLRPQLLTMKQQLQPKVKDQIHLVFLIIAMGYTTWISILLTRFGLCGSLYMRSLCAFFRCVQRVYLWNKSYYAEDGETKK